MLELSPETEALARHLAEAQCVSVDEAVRRALESQGPRVTPPKKALSPDEVAARKAAINRAVAKISALPILDHRPIREIVDDLNS